MKITAPVTVELLDAAPVGSRVIFDYDRDTSDGKAVYRRAVDGWLLTSLNGKHQVSSPVRSASIASSWRTHSGRTRILPPRQSAPIRVWSWTATFGRPFYSWRCNTCEDFDVCYYNSQDAHTAGRAHAKGHVEVES